MPGIDEELRQAISYRNEMAVELASNLLRLASEDGEIMWPMLGTEGGIINGRYDQLATDIEALTAVIVQRAGMPWDAMAAPAEVSKQALHRRLHSRGEELFAESLRGSRETDPEALISSLHKAEDTHDWDELEKALKSVPWQSRDLISNLVRLPMPEDILWAPTQLAARLSELRKIPRWWWSWGIGAFQSGPNPLRVGSASAVVSAQLIARQQTTI
ncbi:MAG TPA: hypothetical protein VME67_03745 [Mycobacterium sp.]|nr:hypothetical protein [Mycobacterium sp.]HTX94016.1 hypothetical protein [Mycobacterium sp.]